MLEGEKEAVVMGRGVGFQKKPGDEIIKENIDKIFKLDNPQNQMKIKELLETTTPEYFLVTEKIVANAEKILNTKLAELIYVVLTDHIVFAVERYNSNISLSNPMIWEIKNLYKDEYNIGLWAIDRINQEFKVQLPEDEAGFIALHIVNASLGEEMFNTMNITVLTKDVLKIVKKHFNIEFKEDSLEYIRLVTHLKFFAQRIFKRQQLDVDDSEIYELIQTKYLNELECVNKIGGYIDSEFNYQLTKQEMVYLVLHIQRIISNYTNKK